MVLTDQYHQPIYEACYFSFGRRRETRSGTGSVLAEFSCLIAVGCSHADTPLLVPPPPCSSPPLTPRWGPTPTAAPASSPRPPSCAPGPPATAGSSPASSAGTRRASRSAPWTTRRTARSASTPPSPSRATPTRWACTRTRTRPTNTTSTSRCTSPTRGTASTPPTTGSSATTWTGTFPVSVSPVAYVSCVRVRGLCSLWCSRHPRLSPLRSL